MGCPVTTRCGSRGDAFGPLLIFCANRVFVEVARSQFCMHNACMVALQIRDVSDDVRDALVMQAKVRGQSLQAYLLELVETQARRLRNTAVLDRFAGRADGTRSLPGETAAELAEQRERPGRAA
jgi:antitoxin FitA